jgi:hypothetical protein
MLVVALASLDMQGKSSMTFIAYETERRLADLADGVSLELLPRPARRWSL